MDNTFYETMCNKILQNKDCYGPVSITMLERFKQEFYSLCDGAVKSGAFSRKKYGNALEQNIREFWHCIHFPKSIKMPWIHQGDPSSLGMVQSESASQLIDKHLHVVSLASYVKETLRFLQIVDNLVIPENVYLVMIDVELLYNSFPHKAWKWLDMFYLNTIQQNGSLMNSLWQRWNTLCTIMFFNSKATTTYRYKGWLWWPVVPPHMPTCIWGSGNFCQQRILQFTIAR